MDKNPFIETPDSSGQDGCFRLPASLLITEAVRKKQTAGKTSKKQQKMQQPPDSSRTDRPYPTVEG